jgi:Xaa-Pro aminopeptidase
MTTLVDQYKSRLTAVRDNLSTWGADALLIGSPANRRWLSGFSGSAGWLLITADQALLATDFRYWQQAENQAPAFTLFRLRNHSNELFQEFIQASGVQRVAVEAEHMTLARFDSLNKIEGVAWLPLNKSVEPLRHIKSAVEMAAIRAAAAMTDRAMARVHEIARPGMTEQELAWELEKWLREGGADAVAFPIIVAAGPNGALSHHRPGDQRLQLGDSIVIDMGASRDGYQSDMTRTFHLGAQPDARFWKIYNLVAQAHETTMAHMRPGMTGKAIDALARDVIIAGAYGEQFGHSLGHGVGLEVHEGPRLSFLAEDEIIPVGAVVTVEPGIYIPGWGGVRIEDLVLVTENGLEAISRCPKTPVIGEW